MLSPAKCTWILFLSLFFLLITASLSHAGLELTYLTGILRSPDETGDTFVTMFEYLQEGSSPFAFSVSYLNEGHLEDPEKHHRDGFVLQLWARKPVLAPWFTLAAGIGPYYWYDTHSFPGNPDAYDRGLGVMGSAGAKIDLPYGGLFLQGRFNWVHINDNVNTQSVLLGIGTNFSSKGVADKSLPVISQDLRNEVLYFFYNLTKSGAKGIEYRRTLGILGGHVEASASYYYRNKSLFEKYRSYGAAAQLWLVNTYKARLKFGFGGGVYLDLLDSPRNGSGTISYLIAYRVSNHWNLQYHRSRILPNEEHEEDIRMLTVGYLF
jgi:hypothetical protein